MYSKVPWKRRVLLYVISNNSSYEMKVLIYRQGEAIVDCIDYPVIVNPGVFEKILGIVKPVKLVF